VSLETTTVDDPSRDAEPDVEEGASGDPGEDPGFDVAAFPGGTKSAIEAVLMVVDEPVSAVSLASAMEVTVDEVTAARAELEQEYAAAHRGFTLRSVGGGWRVYSRPDYAPVVEKFLLDGQQARLTHAALETLAVIAYRQPVSRGRVSAIRGVNVDGVIRTLLTRGLIEELDEAGEGGSILYGTTSYFLERMGLGSLDELPAIAPFLPEVDALDELAERGRG
jgi:segregation and condensation protein B